MTMKSKHRIVIEPTGETGLSSGRPRYRVICEPCGVIIHSGTTAPDVRVGEHLSGEPGYEVSLVEPGEWRSGRGWPGVFPSYIGAHRAGKIPPG